MGAEIADPTEDTGKGTEGTAQGRNRRYKTIEAVQDSVAEEGVMLVGDRTGRTAELEVHKGVMKITQSPPPHHHQGGQRMQISSQNCRDGGRLA